MKPKKPTDKQLIKTAKNLYHEAGSIEIDAAAEVSMSDDPATDGAYVQAWVWVAFDDVVFHTEPEHATACDCRACRPELYV